MAPPKRYASEEERRAASAARRRARRAQQSIEERSVRLQRDADRKRAKRALESEEERADRLRRDAERKRVRLQETDEERKERLQKETESDAQLTSDSAEYNSFVAHYLDPVNFEDKKGDHDAKSHQKKPVKATDEECKVLRKVAKSDEQLTIENAAYNVPDSSLSPVNVNEKKTKSSKKKQMKVTKYKLNPGTLKYILVPETRDKNCIKFIRSHDSPFAFASTGFMSPDETVPKNFAIVHRYTPKLNDKEHEGRRKYTKINVFNPDLEAKNPTILTENKDCNDLWIKGEVMDKDNQVTSNMTRKIYQNIENDNQTKSENTEHELIVNVEIKIEKDDPVCDTEDDTESSIKVANVDNGNIVTKEELPEQTKCFDEDHTCCHSTSKKKYTTKINKMNNASPLSMNSIDQNKLSTVKSDETNKIMDCKIEVEIDHMPVDIECEQNREKKHKLTRKIAKSMSDTATIKIKREISSDSESDRDSEEQALIVSNFPIVDQDAVKRKDKSKMIRKSKKMSSLDIPCNQESRKKAPPNDMPMIKHDITTDSEEHDTNNIDISATDHKQKMEDKIVKKSKSVLLSGISGFRESVTEIVTIKSEITSGSDNEDESIDNSDQDEMKNEDTSEIIRKSKSVTPNCQELLRKVPVIETVTIKSEINSFSDHNSSEVVMKTEPIEVKNKVDTVNESYNSIDFENDPKSNYVSEDVHLTSENEDFMESEIIKPNTRDSKNCKKRLTAERKPIQAGDKIFSCEFCQYKFMKRNALVRHMRTHTGEKPYSCDICQYKTTQKNTLTTHLRTHTGEKPFTCKHCLCKFRSRSTLNSHIRTHTGEKPFSCKFCEYRCTQKNTLVTHLRTHTGEKPFSCKFCQYRFGSKSGLNTHTRTHTGEKTFTCERCTYKSARKSHLIMHMRTHTGEKPYNCDLCYTKFAQKTHLITHMRSHTGEKSHFCELCRCQFARKSTLLKHMTTHTGNKPHSCKICQIKFAQKHNVMSHMRIHTGKFSCDFCDYKCTKEYNLIKHMEVHSEATSFSCEVCHCSFIFKNHLLMHMRIHTD